MRIFVTISRKTFSQKLAACTNNVFCLTAQASLAYDVTKTIILHNFTKKVFWVTMLSILLGLAKDLTFTIAKNKMNVHYWYQKDRD